MTTPTEDHIIDHLDEALRLDGTIPVLEAINLAHRLTQWLPLQMNLLMAHAQDQGENLTTIGQAFGASDRAAWNRINK